MISPEKNSIDTSSLIRRRELYIGSQGEVPCKQLIDSGDVIDADAVVLYCVSKIL